MTVRERLGAQLLGQIDVTAPPNLLVDRLDPLGHTILFGMPGTGKGTLASSWIVQHVRDEGGRVVIFDFEDHPEEWARRISGLGGKPMFKPDKTGVEPILHFRPLVKGASWDDMVELAGEHAATLVTVDSTAFAVPGRDPSAPDTATTYSSLIQQLQVPVLSLAHTNRAGDTRMPFGSIFWAAGARVTWSLQRAGTADGLLKNQKANNYPWLGSYAVTPTYLGDDLKAVEERPYQQKLADRIAEILAAGPKKKDDIVAELNSVVGVAEVKADSVRKALERGIMPPKRFTISSERWSLAP